MEGCRRPSCSSILWKYTGSLVATPHQELLSISNPTLTHCSSARTNTLLRCRIALGNKYGMERPLGGESVTEVDTYGASWLDVSGGGGGTFFLFLALADGIEWGRAGV
jgi:hypothetical protein